MRINAFQKNATGPELDATMPPTYSSRLTKLRCSYLRLLLKIHYHTTSSILSKGIWKKDLKKIAKICCGCIHNASNYTSKNLEWIELTHSIRVLLDAGSARPPPLAFRAPEPERHSLHCEASRHWCIPNNTGIACTATTISKRRSGGAGDRKYERRWQQDYTTPGHRHCSNSCHKVHFRKISEGGNWSFSELSHMNGSAILRWSFRCRRRTRKGGTWGVESPMRIGRIWMKCCFPLELFIQCGIPQHSCYFQCN